MGTLRFALHAAAVLAPGLDTLAALRLASRQGQPVARVEAAPLPAPACLPANERRRASQAVRLALACVERALADSPFAADTLRTVCATDEGTGEVCLQMLEALATDRQVSPLAFPNSVQNAPSGNFSIAYGNREPGSVVSFGIESFASGLLCAAVDATLDPRPVMLVSYDPAMPEPLAELLPVTEPTACTWIVAADGLGGAAGAPLARFELQLADRREVPASPLPAWLPAHWSAHSSARAIAALGLLEAPAATRFNLPLGERTLVLARLAGADA